MALERPAQRFAIQLSALVQRGRGGAANDAAKRTSDAVKGVVSSKEIGVWREGLAATRQINWPPCTVAAGRTIF